MKLSKDELKAKIDEKITDEDLKIELLEDVEDSIDIVEDEVEKVLKEDYDKILNELADLKEKYKARFLSKDDIVEEKVEDVLEEKDEEIIDVKEI